MSFLIETYRYYQEALTKAKNNQTKEALDLLNTFAVKLSGQMSAANPTEYLELVAAIALCYETMEEWELLALKMEDVCFLAEHISPGTDETFVDYCRLASAYDKIARTQSTVSKQKAYFLKAKQAYERGLTHADDTEQYAAFIAQIKQTVKRLDTLLNS